MKSDVLSYIARAEGKVTWYHIAKACYDSEYVKEGTLMKHINQLLEKGFIRGEAKEGFLHPVYYLTAKGRESLGITHQS